MNNQKFPVVHLLNNDPDINGILAGILTEQCYQIIITRDERSCLEKIRDDRPELLILNDNLLEKGPGQICGALESKDIPVLLIKQDRTIETLQGYSENNVQPLKSENVKDLLSRVKSILSIKKLEDRLSEKNRVNPESKDRNKKHEFHATYYQTIKSLAKVIEEKSSFTQSHSYKVAQYAVDIAIEMGFSEPEVLYIKEAAELHDLGNIAISKKILEKEGKLTAQEWDEIKKHPLTCAEMLKPFAFLNGTKEAIEQHHERFDGSGYPYGKKGSEIPMAARILAVADAFDAMTSDRPYRKAYTIEHAVKELKNNSGKQFDPVVVKSFLKILGQE